MQSTAAENIFFMTHLSFFPFLLQDAGIWFVFHSSSTGDSHGLVPETKAELTPLGIFYNNRVHSNFKVSLVFPLPPALYMKSSIEDALKKQIFCMPS